MELPVELPEDTVRKILAKLPVSTLLRFSCVCKLWRDLVIKMKNPNLFGEKHLENPNNFCNDQPTLVFLKNDFPAAAKYSLLTHKMQHVLAPPDEGDPLVEVKAACNGIVCLAHRDDADVVYLHNPITSEVLKLPPSLFSDEAKYRCCGHVLGFGFDASCNDYKVIRFIRQNLRFDQEIYRLSTRRWSKLELDYNYRVFYRDHSDGVLFFNGFFHWPITRSAADIHNLHSDEKMILTFNFQAEKLGEMQYPFQLSPKNCTLRLYLAEVDASLAVCSYYDKLLQVWVMSEYGEKESWAMKFSVDLSDSVRRVLSVRVHNTRLVMLGAFYTRSGGGLGWREEGGGFSTVFEGGLGHDSSWAVFRPSLVSLSQQAR